MAMSRSSSLSKKTDGDDEKINYVSTEKLFECQEVPSWQNQLTLRAFVVSFFLSILFTVIVLKLSLSTGVIPSLNISAGLLGFFFVKIWTAFLDKCGWLKQPFTRQENTVIQTCVVAASGLAFSGGFGTYLFGMSDVVAKQSTEAYDAQNIKEPAVGWMIGFLFVVSFLGLFCVVPLRKFMIVDFKLMYPSGTATAHLINSFHTPQGAEIAKKQVRTLGKYFSLSFLWSFFKWFFASGKDCGFAEFPTFGLEAHKNKFFFDFSATYVGVGMICPYIINISMLLGSIIAYGIMWPLISTKKGDWYSAEYSNSSLHSLSGYQVFIAIAIILGDGLYHFVKVLVSTSLALYNHYSDNNNVLPVNNNNESSSDPPSFDQQRRTQFFLKDQIPPWIAIVGYLTLAVVSIVTLPHMFPPLKWYYILVIYLVAPVLAFCNAYGCGLTDWSLASSYGKLAIFAIGAWAGSHYGGVLAALAACGVMMNIASTAADLTQDFKTGYMTLSSPRSMFLSQLIGTAMGCVISPCVFWLFYNAFRDNGFGVPNSPYPAPYALIYRNMAILGVEGFSALPKYCLTLCCIFFGLAIVINGIRDFVGPRWAKFIPLPMAMAIPFYLGGYFAIDMCVGSLILFVWTKIDKAKADTFGPAVASGLICGDGLWALPDAILGLAGLQPPICMKFLSRSTNSKVDAFLSS